MQKRAWVKQVLWKDQVEEEEWLRSGLATRIQANKAASLLNSLTPEDHRS